MDYAKNINAMAGDIYRYLNFDQIQSYQEAADNIIAKAG